MIITINGINEDAMETLINTCSERVVVDREREGENLFTIALNSNVILTTFDDDVLIDLAGNKYFLHRNEFFTIEIE